MTSVSGVFEAHEVLNPTRADVGAAGGSGAHASPFTALQADLLRVPQPGERRLCAQQL